MLHAIALVVAASFGSAATFDVTDSIDPGTLRTSVGSANVAGGTNSVVWNGTGGTITLGSTLTINGGNTLDVSSAAAPVTIAGSPLSLGGAVTFANSNVGQPWTISSDIQGTGGLTAVGNGTFVLSGANTYLGGTTVSGGGVLSISSGNALGAGNLNLALGTLQTAAPITFDRTIILTTSGTIDTNGFDSTFSGFIGGGGQLIKQGAGTLFLTAGNDYLGGTYLAGGVLDVVSDSNLGTGGLTFDGGTLRTSASIADGRTIGLLSGGGTLDNAGNTDSFVGLITGAGGLVVTGTGTVALAGTNTYLGGTTVTGGATLAAMTSDANLGDAAGSIVLDSGTLQTRAGITSSRSITLGAGGGTIDNFSKTDLFSGPITGAGALLFMGTGTVTLSGANSWMGGTTVGAGTLAYGANDVLPAGHDLSIASGASVDLFGFSQSTGAAIGNVNNNGLLNLRSGSMNLSTYGGSGTLAVSLVSGFTNLNAGSVNLTTSSVLSVTLANPYAVAGSTFTPVAWSTHSGTFSIVSPALLTFNPIYNTNGLTLTLSLVPLTSVAATPNQRGVAAALEPYRTGTPSADMGNVLSNLYTLKGPQVQAALDQIGPISLAAVGNMGMAATSVQTAALDRRMSALAAGTDSGLDAYSIQQRSFASGALLAEDGVSDASVRLLDSKGPKEESGGSFFSLVGSQVILNNLTSSAGTQPGYIFSGGGFVSGIDHRLSENLAAGLSLGYLYGKSSIDAPAAGVAISNSARYGAYATAFIDTARLNMYLGGAQDYFSTNRGIDFAGLARSATADPNGSEINWSVRGETDFRTPGLGTFTPFAQLNSDHLTIRPYTESGAGALNLAVAEQTANSLRSTIGLRDSFTYADQYYNCGGYISAGWQHEFDSQSRPIQAQLASGGGTAFSVTTADIPRDGAVIGAGFSVKASGQSTAHVDYSYGFLSGYSENRLSATLRYRY